MSFKDKFESFPILETGRLVLRELRPEDAEDLYAYYSDPEVYRYLDWYGPASVEKAGECIEHFCKWYEGGHIIRWGITLRGEDRVIGTFFFGHFAEGSKSEIGYELGRKYWGRGIMSEVLEAAIPFGFETLGLHRIQAIVNPGNPASLRVLAKAGFAVEGRLREYERHSVTGRFNDVIILSILKSEYRRNK